MENFKVSHFLIVKIFTNNNQRLQIKMQDETLHRDSLVTDVKIEGSDCFVFLRGLDQPINLRHAKRRKVQASPIVKERQLD